MSFTTADNPFIQRDRYLSKPPQRARHEVDGRVFEETGERRRAHQGEFVLGLFGVAVANNDTVDELPILSEVTV